MRKHRRIRGGDPSGPPQSVPVIGGKKSGDGIEIVSPSFMNQRPQSPGVVMRPPESDLRRRIGAVDEDSIPEQEVEPIMKRRLIIGLVMVSTYVLFCAAPELLAAGEAARVGHEL